MCECQDVMSARRKRIVLEYAEGVGSVTKACREFEVPRSSFYRWKAAFALEGVKGLRKRRPVAWKHPRQLSSESIEKILHRRRHGHVVIRAQPLGRAQRRHGDAAQSADLVQGSGIEGPEPSVSHE